MTEPLIARSLKPSPGTTAALLRVSIDLRHLGDQPLDALRRVLVADVLRRVYEHVLAGRTVSATLGEVAELPSLFTHLASSCGLDVPWPGYESTAALSKALGAPPSVEVVSTDDTRRSDVAGLESLIVRVGPVAATGRVQQLVGTPTQGDPFALRLALLRFPYHVPATLTMARMRRADETLDRWRFKVANWKDMPAPRTGALVSPVAALLDGLDTATVLHLMHRVESDHTIASGAKFIAFVELDQVLGLDLQRYVGLIR